MMSEVVEKELLKGVSKILQNWTFSWEKELKFELKGSKQVEKTLTIHRKSHYKQP